MACRKAYPAHGASAAVLALALSSRHGFKVVLTGEGSDEFLGGYDIFKEAKIRRFWAVDLASRYRPLLLKRLYPYVENLQAQSDAYLKAFFHVDPSACPIHSSLIFRDGN